MITNSGDTRIFSKRMLLDVINEIYESKKQYDLKCQENKVSNETLEQYMYSYLNHKYGLKVFYTSHKTFYLTKNLIIEWANTIINGIKAFSAEDSEILLFGKILKNEVEENAKVVLEKLKQTIPEFLEVKLFN